jgi:hypothetical protein
MNNKKIATELTAGRMDKRIEDCFNSDDLSFSRQGDNYYLDGTEFNTELYAFADDGIDANYVKGNGGECLVILDGERIYGVFIK